MSQRSTQGVWWAFICPIPTDKEGKSISFELKDDVRFVEWIDDPFNKQRHGIINFEKHQSAYGVSSTLGIERKFIIPANDKVGVATSPGWIGPFRLGERPKRGPKAGTTSKSELKRKEQELEQKEKFLIEKGKHLEEYEKKLAEMFSLLQKQTSPLRPLGNERSEYGAQRGESLGGGSRQMVAPISFMSGTPAAPSILAMR